MSYQVIDPFLEFTNPVNGQPISVGSVYFGRPDSDPKNQPANRISVYAVQDNGTEVLLSQPITLNAAGQPQYNGSPKQLKIELAGSDTSYCVQVFDKNGAQKLYTSRVFPVVDLASLSAASSTLPIAGVPAWQVAATTTDYTDVMTYIPQALHAAIRGYSNTADLTAYMQAAHNTGKIVRYPKGKFKFSTLTIPAGGIEGDYKNTVLDSTDTTTGNIITYTGQDPEGLLINERGGYFANFYLRVDSMAQKASGAGIYINSGNTIENYTTYIGGVTIRNVPTSVKTSNASFLTIERNYFAFFKSSGLLMDNDTVLFGDNGDNVIANNTFYTTQPAFAIKYRTGGGRIFGNKINGGLIGIDISPLRDSSIILAQGNSIENQTINAIRFFTEPDSSATDYTQVSIIGNQIGGYNLTGNAIQINPSAFSLKNLIVSSNIILSPVSDTNAIDIRNTDRFAVADNMIDCMNTGYGGIFIAASATSGVVSNNRVNRFTTNYTQILSTSTQEIRVVSQLISEYTVPSIAAGATHQLDLSVANCILGDKAVASVSVNANGLIITAWIKSDGITTVQWYNPTASAINLGLCNIRVEVFK